MSSSTGAALRRQGPGGPAESEGVLIGAAPRRGGLLERRRTRLLGLLLLIVLVGVAATLSIAVGSRGIGLGTVS